MLNVETMMKVANGVSTFTNIACENVRKIIQTINSLSIERTVYDVPLCIKEIKSLNL